MLTKLLNHQWPKAALVRSIRTMAQTALSMLTIGMAVTEVNWINLISITFVSGLYSFLTSVVTNLPELDDSVTNPDGSS